MIFFEVLFNTFECAFLVLGKCIVLLSNDVERCTFARGLKITLEIGLWFLGK